MIAEYFAFIGVIAMININLWFAIKDYGIVPTFACGLMFSILSFFVPFQLQTQVMLRIGGLALIIIAMMKMRKENKV